MADGLRYHQEMVQTAEAEEIRQRWIERGRPECSHEHKDKERYLGSDTGDWACLSCGLTWPRSEDPPKND